MRGWYILDVLVELAYLGNVIPLGGISLDELFLGRASDAYNSMVLLRLPCLKFFCTQCILEAL